MNWTIVGVGIAAVGVVIQIISFIANQEARWARLLAGGLVVFGAGFLTARLVVPSGAAPLDEPVVDCRKKLVAEGVELVPENLKLYANDTMLAPKGMALIPAGEFEMGDAEGTQYERDVHTVYLDAFYIDLHEVTSTSYQEFMRETKRPKPASWDGPWDEEKFIGPGLPVVGVTWDDASDYCAWLGKRLPTEAEWEKAARGGLVGKRYPWGDTISYDYANFLGVGGPGIGGNDTWGSTSPVDSFAPNGYGLYNMAGNVAEWCSDYFDGDYYRRPENSKNPKGALSGDKRVIRGGAWHSPLDNDAKELRNNFLRVAYRGAHNPSSSEAGFGFRCAQDVRSILTEQ